MSIKLKINEVILFCFILSGLVFLLSALDVFNIWSDKLHKFLFHTLGYTVNQGNAFGPLWFFHFNSNLGAIASKEILVLVTIGISIILRKTNHFNTLKKFLYEIVGGIILFIVIKYSLNTNLEIVDFLGVKLEDTQFPSGHAYTASILYISIYFLCKKFLVNKKIIKFLKFYFALLIFLVGVSRLLGGNHSLTEVLGGWSLGVFWVLFLQIIWKLESQLIGNKN